MAHPLNAGATLCILGCYWKKRISTTCTLQVYTAKFILEASHQCQRETPKEDKILYCG